MFECSVDLEAVLFFYNVDSDIYLFINALRSAYQLLLLVQRDYLRTYVWVCVCDRV